MQASIVFILIDVDEEILIKIKKWYMYILLVIWIVHCGQVEFWGHTSKQSGVPYEILDQHFTKKIISQDNDIYLGRTWFW
jgi:hypothetical protein